MNHASTVIKFVLFGFLILFCSSVLSYIFNFSWRPFDNINLVSLVVGPSAQSQPNADSLQKEMPLVLSPKNAKKFEIYQSGGVITDFSNNQKQAALFSLMQKLHTLKTTGKGKVRIAYFGDSMIEGDLITQTIRKLLQQEFGGKGVGYLPVTSPVAKFRTTAGSIASEGWEDVNFKSKNRLPLFLSGHVFLGNPGADMTLTDRTSDTASVLNKIILYGSLQNELELNANGNIITLQGKDDFNTMTFTGDGAARFRLSQFSSALPLYGVSFESENGVIVDNFSFRGISGIELNKFDSSFLQQINSAHPYDLIVFQYGVNMLFRPEDKNFNWYGKAFRPVVEKFRKNFPASNLMMVSTADRAFRYNGNYESAHGIDSLIKVQAGIAYNCGIGFYNQFETMGGHESIVRWANTVPSLANKDYVHPNFRGAEVLGKYFFDALMKDYQKYIASLP